MLNIPTENISDEEFDVYLAAELDRICEKGRLAKRCGGGAFFVNDFRPKPLPQCGVFLKPNLQRGKNYGTTNGTENRRPASLAGDVFSAQDRRRFD